MAPALTEPVAQSDISGQSPRPGDSITTHTDTITVADSATENQRNLLNNGKNKFIANGQSPLLLVTASSAPAIKYNNKLASVEENLLAAPDDQARSRRSSAHMDQSECSQGAADQDAADTTPTPPPPPPQQQLPSPAANVSPVKPLDQPGQQSKQQLSTAQPEDMGLPKDFGKESAEVEQMLGDLAASGEIDLLSVIKTLESTPSDPSFDLAGGLSLFADEETMKEYEDVGEPSTPPPEEDNQEQKIEEWRSELEQRQAQMQRKCDFLLRRLKRLQARQLMRHTCREIAGVLEHTQRFLKKKEREKSDADSAAASTSTAPEPSTSSILSEVLPYQPPPPVPGSSSSPDKATGGETLRPVSAPAMRQLIKRLEATANYQRATFTKRQLSAKYFSPELTEPPPAPPGTSRLPPGTYTTIPRFEDKVIEQIDSVSGLLQAELRIVQKALDSDATASSSGGESADEMVLYSNPTQERLKM